MVSCGQSNNKKVDLEKITQLGDLAEIDSLSLFLGLPTIVKLFDNKLFIVDMFDEGKIVKIYDLEKRKYFCLLLKREKDHTNIYMLTILTFIEIQIAELR